MLSFIAKICPAEPLERKLSAVSEGKGVQSVARPIITEGGMVENGLNKSRIYRVRAQLESNLIRFVLRHIRNLKPDIHSPKASLTIFPTSALCAHLQLRD